MDMFILIAPKAGILDLEKTQTWAYSQVSNRREVWNSRGLGKNIIN